MPKILESLIENIAQRNVELRAQAFAVRNGYVALRRDGVQHLWHGLLLLALLGLVTFGVKRPYELPIWDTLTPYAWWLSALYVVAEASLIARDLRRRAGRQAQDWLAVLPIAARARVQARVFFAALRALLRMLGVFSVGLVGLASMPASLRSLWWAPGISALMLALLIDGGLLLHEFRVPRVPATEIQLPASHPNRHPGARRGPLGHTRETIFSTKWIPAFAGMTNSAVEPLLLWWRSERQPMARFAWWWLLPGLLFPLGSSLIVLAGLLLLVLALLKGSAAMGATQRTLSQVSALLSPFPWTPAALYRASCGLVARALVAPLLLLVLGLSAFSAPLWLLLLAALGATGWVTLHLHCAYRYRRTPRRFEMAFLLQSMLLLSLSQALPLLAPLCLLFQSFRLYREGAKWQ